jgi:phosphatidylinositol kinase/protein kinase (PI-3  family)
MQLVEYFKTVFELEGLDIFLRPYQIMSTGAQCGLVEYLEGTESVDRIKKSMPRDSNSLKQYFALAFGAPYSVYHAKAVHNFVKSLVGYSLLTYLVQVYTYVHMLNGFSFARFILNIIYNLSMFFS